MNINEVDDNQLIEELANRGIDVRQIKDFTDEDILSESKRRFELMEVALQARHDAEMASDADEIQEALQDSAEVK